MRVLHLVPEFSPLTETFIYDLLLELDGRVAEQVVLARRRVNERTRPFPGFRPWKPRDRWPGQRYAEWLAWRVLRRGGWSWGAHRRALDEAVRDLRPDVIHAHFGPEGALAAPVAARRSVPLVTSFYGFDASGALRDPGWRALYQHLWAAPNCVLALSGVMREALRAAGCPGERVRVLATGKRLAGYAFSERRLPPSRFVTVGRLVAKKGHLDAIRAIERLVRAGEAATLDVVGAGPLHDELARYVTSNGLDGVVRLRGALEHATMVEALSAADAFILCSRTGPDGDQEGVPTVLLEAQALGLPCVSTRHAGIPEALPEVNHWMLAPEGDVDALFAVLRRLRSCTPTELSALTRAGREHVLARYDVARQARLLASAYADVRDRARSGASAGR